MFTFRPLFRNFHTTLLARKSLRPVCRILRLCCRAFNHHSQSSDTCNIFLVLPLPKTLPAVQTVPYRATLTTQVVFQRSSSSSPPDESAPVADHIVISVTAITYSLLRTGNMSTTETFHPFPRLPWELRAMVWEFTIEPRQVDIRVVFRQVQGKSRKTLLSRARVPAILHVCQQSRYLGLYKQAFIDLPHQRVPDIQPKYFWINWNHDTLVIGRTELSYLRHESIQNSIQRLEMDRSQASTPDIEHLRAFPKLKKLLIHGSVPNFLHVFRDFPIACSRKNIFLEDSVMGTWNCFEADELFGKMFESLLPGDGSAFIVSF